MADDGANHVLFHNPHSICSIMVRYCFALRGPPKDRSQEIRIREENVDIFHEEQLSEHYLCDINAFGEVPVIAPLPIDKTIPDSLKITFYLAGFYANMIPSSKEREISDYLRQLHAINYYSLTFTGKPETIQGIQEALQKRIEDNISQRYRDAIDFKLAHMEQSRVHAIEPESVEQNRQRAIALTRELGQNLAESKTGWLFGFETPTALDAHLIVFVQRMMEVERSDIVPENLQRYTANACETDQWKGLGMNGTTKPPGV